MPGSGGMTARAEERRLIDEFLATRGATVVPAANPQDIAVDRMIAEARERSGGGKRSQRMARSIGRSWQRTKAKRQSNG